MAYKQKTRPGKEHKETTREAGIGPVSLVSILAGTLCAYGAFSLIAALAGTLLSRADVDTEFRTNDWTGSGAVAALASAFVLLLAYLFGGYVAGRMAVRRGLIHGLGVAILSLVLGAVIGAVVGGLSDNQDVEDNLRSIGVPTTTDQITGVAIVGLMISLAAIIVGAILGGILGERWHTRLARRAADPGVGPAAELRDLADRHDDDRRDRHVERDESVRREVAPAGHRDRDDRDRGDRDRGDRDRGDRDVDVSDRATPTTPPDAQASRDHDRGRTTPDWGTQESGDDDERLTATEWRQRESDARRGTSSSGRDR